MTLSTTVVSIRTLGSRAKLAATFFMLLVGPGIRGEELMGGAVSYNPPIPMLSGDEAGNAGLPISGCEFRTEGGKNGYAQVNLQVMSVMTLFPKPSEPPVEIRSFSDLKAYIDSSLKGKTNIAKASVVSMKLGGRDAVGCSYERTSGPGPSKWFQSVFLFWDNNPQWMRSSLFHVMVTAEKKETFDTLVKSLETVKIKPRAK